MKLRQPHSFDSQEKPSSCSKNMSISELESYAEAINSAYARAVSGVIGAACHLNEAKKSLAHGQWIQFCELLGLSRFRAAKLIKIGSHLGLRASKNARFLPIDEEVLYILAQMSLSDFEEALAKSAITPKLTRAAAIRLRDGSA